MFARHRATHEAAPLTFANRVRNAASATPAFPTVNGAEASTPAPSPIPQTLTPKPVPASVPSPVAVPASEPEHLAPLPLPVAGQVVGQALPIYFVGDESHSMRGDPIAAVNQGLVELRDEVAKHPLIGKNVRFGIVTFADTAETRLKLSELREDLILPTLATRGRGTSYASAFEGSAAHDPRRYRAAEGERLAGAPAGGVLSLRRPAHRERGQVAGGAG